MYVNYKEHSRSKNHANDVYCVNMPFPCNKSRLINTQSMHFNIFVLFHSAHLNNQGDHVIIFCHLCAGGISFCV